MIRKSSDVTDGAGQHAAWIFAREATADLARATQEWMSRGNWDAAARLAERHQNQAAYHRAGHTFEFVETLKFNVASARAGDVLRAATTASQGQPTAATDIIISRGDQVVTEVQAKLYGRPAEALSALRADKYEGMQRLVPSDQEPEMRRLLGQRLGLNPDGINVSGYRDVDEHLSPELRHGDISSGGTTSHEANRAGNDPRAWLRDQSIEAMANETLKAAAIGAAGGAVFTAAAHSLQSVMRVRRGELGVAESIVELATVSATAGVRSGMTSGLAKVVEIGARNTTVLSPLAMTTAPIAIASAVLATGEAAYQYALGRISPDELIECCGAVVIRNTGAWAFGVVGQVVVPVPVLGALVGSTVGYVTSAVLMEGFKLARAAAAAADASEAALDELQAHVMHAIKTMEEHRLMLETLIKQEAEQFASAVLPAMDAVERALLDDDDDAAMGHLVTLNLELGAKLDWSSLPESDEFMDDAATPFRL